MKKKTMRNKIRLLILGLLFMLPSFYAPAQGWVITDSDGSKTLISDGWIKTIDPDGESYLSTFNVNTRKLIIIDPEEKIYAEGTMDDYCAAIRMIEDQMKENMSDEQIKMMEEFMESQGDQTAPDVDIQKVGSEDIAGFATDKYHITVNGELYEEIWLASATELKELIDLAREMDDMIGEMVDCSIYTQPGNEPESSEKYMEMMSRGIELRSVEHEYGEPEVATDVVSIEKKTIDKGEFLPPEGYSEVPLADIMMMK